MPTTDELRSMRIEDIGMAPRRGLGRWLRWWIVVGSRWAHWKATP